MDYPDLDQIIYPRFEFPWPGGCHPEVKNVEERMTEWGSAHGLIPDEDYRARITRTRYGFLAARCYPRAGLKLLQAIADYFLWFFLADDLFVDRVDTVTADTIANLTAMIDVLDYNRHRPVPAYGEIAWLDVCRRLRGCLSGEHFDRFATGMRMWASTAGLQILNHLQPHPIEICHYETIRRHTSGMNPCLALSDAANAGPVTPDEYHQPAVQQMRMHANNIVCWSNDIQSLAVEARQPGQFRNVVTVYASQGRTLQEGVDITAQRVRKEVSDLAQLSEEVAKHASAALLGYITGMKDWTRGYQDWFDHDTERYAAEHAAHDADDRDITLPLHSQGSHIRRRGGNDRRRLWQLPLPTVPGQPEASAICSIARNSGVVFSGKDGIRQVSAEMDDLMLFVSSAGFGSVLAVLAGRQADAGVVGYETGQLIKSVQPFPETRPRMRGAAVRVPETHARPPAGPC